MIRLITVIAIAFMPIIAVSTGSTERDSVIHSRDILDQKGCTRDGYCPGDPPPPFSTSGTSR